MSRLGLVVPCRDESLVLERKLRNLARCSWPRAEAGSARPHALFVVDDHSTDDTLALARRLCAECFDPGLVEAVAVASDQHPGKPGALRVGLALAHERGVDLVGMTDADVVLGEDALERVAAGFAASPDLAMASGVQRFVAALPPDGSSPAEGVDAGGRYDHITRLVRAGESRLGLLFSVHGQLLFWRAGLGLSPRDGIAADDLELVTQLRSHGRAQPWRCELLRSARFYELKTPAGPAASAQAQRRARAYVQALRASRPPASGPLALAQWLGYRILPIWAPELTLAGWILVLAASSAQPRLLAALLLLSLVFALTPPGRGLLALLGTIRTARRAESAAALPAHWDMAREELTE